ncbi:uncharacterized protein LOC143374861 [Andrena cerasifolii]|uniref:uncharacterized protein LOC143374861 n=1 Tax=Andrena cerasifolii TaxID=2819439 RepID=UPI004037D838
MLEFSIHSGVWILTIFLLIVSVARTGMCNTTNALDYPPRRYHHNHWYRGQLNNSNISLTSTCVPQHFTNQSPSDTYLYDSLSFVKLFESNKSESTVEDLDELRRSPKSTIGNTAAYVESAWIPNSLVNVINYSENATRYIETRLSSASNGTPPRLLRRSEEILWKRRTLCAVLDNRKSSAEKFFENDISSGNEKDSVAEGSTLLNHNRPVFMNDMEDSDSLKPHIRVKRNTPDSSSGSSFMYQQDYLKDLANSFPRNSYESIDEDSDDYDEASFETKREVKSQDDQSVGPLNRRVETENDQSKVADTRPRGKEYLSVANRQSQDRNSEISSPQEDPMLAVELVRKKRNDYGKPQNTQSLDVPSLSRPSGEQLTGSISSETNQNSLAHRNIKVGESLDDEKRLVGPVELKGDLHADRKRSRSSSLAVASLKADLLRLKRRAKSERREKSSKTKKKRKHVEKKHDTLRGDSPRSKNAIRSRALRKRKNSEISSEGKSNVRIASKLVSKRNNANNFRRRSVKAKKSIERIDSENDRSPKGVRLKTIGENRINGHGSELSSIARGGSDAGDVKAGSDESSKGATVAESKRSISPREDVTKLRAKREKSTARKHGFLNEQDELRYYEHIREPEPGVAQCVGQDGDGQSSEGSEADGGRAARSIEEVKDLAKKLVTKVNELESYLNADDPKRGEKRVETRAIDDLCSNVTTGCAVFKETPKIVQRCVPAKTTSHESTPAPRIIVERRAEPSKHVGEHEHFKGKNGKSPETKRSASERVVRTSKAVRRDNGNTGRKWGRWTDWSSCSVTCGKGRQIRWRYCLRDCSTAETEMEEKACQLPACPPGKFLGIF